MPNLPLNVAPDGAITLALCNFEHKDLPRSSRIYVPFARLRQGHRLLRKHLLTTSSFSASPTAMDLQLRGTPSIKKSTNRWHVRQTARTPKSIMIFESQFIETRHTAGTCVTKYATSMLFDAGLSWVSSRLCASLSSSPTSSTSSRIRMPCFVLYLPQGHERNKKKLRVVKRDRNFESKGLSDHHSSVAEEKLFLNRTDTPEPHLKHLRNSKRR